MKLSEHVLRRRRRARRLPETATAEGQPEARLPAQTRAKPKTNAAITRNRERPYLEGSVEAVGGPAASKDPQEPGRGR